MRQTLRARQDLQADAAHLLLASAQAGAVAHIAKEEADPAERELTDLELARRFAFMLQEANKKLHQQREQGQLQQQHRNA